MKEAYWGYWLVVLGVFIIVVLLLVQSFTSSNTQDYYLVKSITEAAMEDSVDFAYYRQYGEAKINKEKFYESFMRRFAEETSIATTYEIEFTEVYEAPPKVGVKVSSKSNSFSIASDSESFDIVNRIDAILESSVNTGSELLIDEHYADGVSSLLDRLVTDDGSKSNLSNCKIKFTDNNCKTDGEVELKVVKCGKSSNVGVLNGMQQDTNYCIAQKSTDDKCTVTATYNQFKDYYCK